MSLTGRHSHTIASRCTGSDRTQQPGKIKSVHISPAYIRISVARAMWHLTCPRISARSLRQFPASSMFRTPRRAVSPANPRGCPCLVGPIQPDDDLPRHPSCSRRITAPAGIGPGTGRGTGTRPLEPASARLHRPRRQVRCQSPCRRSDQTAVDEYQLFLARSLRAFGRLMPA